MPRAMSSVNACQVCGQNEYQFHTSMKALKPSPRTKQASAKANRPLRSGAASPPTRPHRPHASICHGVHGPWPEEEVRR